MALKIALYPLMLASENLLSFAKEVRDYHGKWLNISSEFEEFGNDNNSDILMLGQEMNSKSVPKSYKFCTTSFYKSTYIATGPPLLVQGSHQMQMLPFDTTVLLCLTVASVVVSLISEVILTIARRKRRRRRRIARMWNYALKLNPCQSWKSLIFGIFRQFLLINSPLITKPIPERLTNGRAARILFSFWLVSLTFLLWNILSYYQAETSSFNYIKIDHLSDIPEYIRRNGAKLKLLKNSMEDMYLKRLADENAFNDALNKLWMNDRIYVDVDDVCTSELYFDISNRKVAFLLDTLARGLFFMSLDGVKKGEITLYISQNPIISIPSGNFVHEKVSVAQTEILTLRSDELFESKPFNYYTFKTKYDIDYKYIWEKPSVPNEVRLTLHSMLFPIIIYVSFNTVILILVIFNVCKQKPYVVRRDLKSI